MVEMADYERWRKNPAYVSWSKKSIDTWNHIVKVRGSIKFASVKIAQKNAEKWENELKQAEQELNALRQSVEAARFANIPIDVKDIQRAQNPEWLGFFVQEGQTFETVFANQASIIKNAREQLEEKARLHSIGIDADTGREIFYDPEKKEYIEVDSEGKQTFKSEDIEITETVSIETGKGHEVPFIAEISVKTRVKKLDTEEMKEREETVQTKLSDYFHSMPGFGQIYAEARLKEGVEYRLRKTTAPEYGAGRIRLEKTKPTPWSKGLEDIDLEKEYQKSTRPSIKKS